MKHHEIRELVNELTKIARDYGQTQQLRDRISRCVLAAIKRHDNPSTEVVNKESLI